jgi:hypothetical protein
VLVKPAKSRNWLGVVRSWTRKRVEPAPVIISKTDSAGTTTGIAK